MTKEEIKQWIRNQIDSSIKIQDKFDKNRYNLIYNKLYLRALKLSTITGQPVNKENFIGGEKTFRINTKDKTFWYNYRIMCYLDNNYTFDSYDHIKIVEEVINEYEQYKGYNII